MKSKESEEEITQLAREKECSQAADYSIKKCVSMLGTIDVTKEEKVMLIQFLRSQKIEKSF